MRYTSSSIERVREADIVKTIENFEELKREGSVYKCRSPFSDEKTPSFVVSRSKQIFKCFSTNMGGDGIKFVMLKKSIDFIEAVKIIAQIHNIYLEEEEVTPEVQRRIDQKAEMYSFIEQVSRKYVATYRHLPSDHWAKGMLKDRGFNDDSIVTFQIGFNESTNSLTKWAIENGCPWNRDILSRLPADVQHWIREQDLDIGS